MQLNHSIVLSGFPLGVVILFGQQNQKFWQIVMQGLRAIVPADKFAPTEAKINSFAAGIGTVVFNEDQQTIASLQQNFPAIPSSFPSGRNRKAVSHSLLSSRH
ncbi:hypothetical protein [Snodgrassella gandavensis]|uniref:hypothetical protein n=1 Tax=Snodgrassella gandavensis TaxID=2946698 RepID=UPI001EF64BF1|nr:hypothetical protein [Snodgrassella gandavensis]